MKLAEMLKGVGAVKHGDFVLSSGKRSSIYIDIKHAATKAEILDLISEEMEKLVRKLEYDKIACIELGGVPIAVALSLKTKKDLVIFRKERKDYGVEGDKIGEINEGERFLVVEDVITTGRSVRRVVERIERSGGVVAGIVAVVDRQESNLNVMSLLKLSDLLENV